MSQTLTVHNYLEPLQASGGVVERRRGGVTSTYWNNYWTAPSEPNPPTWHMQQNTVAALIKSHRLIVTARRHGMPSRCALPATIGETAYPKPPKPTMLTTDD